MRRRCRCGESWAGADVDVGVVVMGVRKVGLHPNLMTQGASLVSKQARTQNTATLSRLLFQPEIASAKYAFTTINLFIPCFKFLATLVALDLTPASQSVSES